MALGILYYNKIPIYPIFYLLKGDYRVYGSGSRVQSLGFRDLRGNS